MALVVPALRLFLLFLNVYETFKTLKPPRRSPRTGEQTPRAISQRKRDMKGCMAIWLLWCSCSVIEGVADSTVGIVMPFYNEIKAIIYLFQIITRARGAEPIYLHVMRPLVKPYVTTLDYALELIHMLGDFVALVVSIPFGFVANWWSPAAAHIETPMPESKTQSAEFASAQAAEGQRERERGARRQPSHGNTVGTRTRGVRQASDSAAGRNAVAGPSKIARPNGIPQSKSDSAFNQQKHKIWRPPANAHDQDEYDERPQVGRRVVSDSYVSTHAVSVEPSTSSTLASVEAGETSMVEGEVEEWRQYPPFPSAYPATPQMKPKPIAVAPSTQHQPALNAVYEMPQPQFHPSALPQPRDRRVKPKAAPGFWAVARAVACESDVEDSDLHGGSGDEFGLTERSLYKDVRAEMEKVETMNLDEMDEERGMDVDEDEEDDDDTFNVTLRTPQRLKTMKDTGSRSHFPSRDFSPPPELRAFHEASEVDHEESEFGATTDPMGFANLAVPSTRRRADSNYTLSSMRATRADSQASLTTVSRASSVRTISRAPSLASRLSSESASDAASDTSSVAGVKRLRPVQDKGAQRKVDEKPVARRVASRTSSEPPGKINVPRAVGRGRASNSYVARSTRPFKTAPASSRPAPKESGKPASPVDVDAYDTPESMDEMGGVGVGGGTIPVKRRKVNAGGPAGRIERGPSCLAQIPEERPTGRMQR